MAVATPGIAPVSIEEPIEDGLYSVHRPLAQVRWSSRAPGGKFAVEIERQEGVAWVALPRMLAPEGSDYLLLDAGAFDHASGALRVRVFRDADATPWRAFSFDANALERVKRAKKLRIGIEKIQHEPFVRWDATAGKHVGFDVELAELLAKDLGAEPIFVPSGWSDLIKPGSAFDAVVSAVSITPDRCHVFAFSRPYLATGQRLVARSDDLPRPATAFSIGVQKDTTSVEIATKTFPLAHVQQLETTDLVFAALAQRTVDAIVTDDALAAARHETKTKSWTLMGELLSHESYGVLLPRGELELVKAIDDSLGRLRTGALVDVAAKYELSESLAKDDVGACPTGD
jgi:ABC-type amino acid transport substrate-binding protein